MLGGKKEFIVLIVDTNTYRRIIIISIMNAFIIKISVSKQTCTLYNCLCAHEIFRNNFLFMYVRRGREGQSCWAREMGRSMTGRTPR